MKIIFLLQILLTICVGAVAQTAATGTIDTTKNFKPYGVVGGLFFGDYARKFEADELKRGNLEYSGTPKNTNAFNIRRVYVSYDYFLSPKFQTELVLAYEGQTPTTSTRNVFIKYMDVRWKNIFKGSDLVFGQLPTPTFYLMERLWGLRFIEKTIADQRGLSPASDLGIALQGRINKTETIGYTLMIGNGSGTHPENDNYKKYYSNIYFKALQKKLVIDVSANYEAINPALHIHKETIKLGLLYQVPSFRVGGEFLLDKTRNGVNTFSMAGSDSLRTAVDQNTLGISLYEVNNWTSKISTFLRFDYFNPDMKFSKSAHYINPYNYNKDYFLTAGLDFHPIDKVHISPNIWYDQFRHKTNPESGKNYDLVGRLTVFVSFK